MCQFFGFQEENQKLLQEWTFKLWAAKMSAVECDWLHGKDINKRVKVSKGVIDAADACTTISAK